TVTNNDAGCGFGWGILNAGPHFYLYDTIVAGNKGSCGGHDLDGPSRTGSANLIGRGPPPGAPAYNRGDTPAHAVLPGSPALDAGDNTDAPPWDQRGEGFPRIVNGTVDIGAFEVQGAGLTGGRSAFGTAFVAAPAPSRLPLPAPAAARQQTVPL